LTPSTFRAVIGVSSHNQHSRHSVPSTVDIHRNNRARPCPLSPGKTEMTIALLLPPPGVTNAPDFLTGAFILRYHHQRWYG
jgi:hypothetical protein